MLLKPKEKYTLTHNFWESVYSNGNPLTTIMMINNEYVLRLFSVFPAKLLKATLDRMVDSEEAKKEGGRKGRKVGYREGMDGVKEGKEREYR